MCARRARSTPMAAHGSAGARTADHRGDRLAGDHVGGRADREKLRRVIAAAVPGIAALVLLFWQTRTGPAAQMLAAAGAAALAWWLVPFAWNSKWSDLEFAGISARAVATTAVVVIGAAPPSRSITSPHKRRPRVRSRSAVPTASAQPVGLSPDRAAAQGDGVHLYRHVPAADHGDASQCDYRPLSSQRAADRGRNECFSRRAELRPAR